MGWKFTATSGSLVPKKFWGISRRSIRPKLQMDIAKQNSDTNDTNLEEDEDQLRLVY